MLLGIVTGGWQLARSAVIATQRLAEGAADADFYRAKILTATFYAEQVIPQATAHLCALEAGAATLSALPDEQF
jgi:acetyl-CoA carboxylase carboxyltransferase component